MKKYSLLIVDDDADDREILRDAFLNVDKSLECLPFESGDSLLEYLYKNESAPLPAVILLDLNMPGKDGRETLKEIKAHQHLRLIPIIVFTTSSSQRDRTVSYTLGANCFITKPDTFDKLTELARSVARLWMP